MIVFAPRLLRYSAFARDVRLLWAELVLHLIAPGQTWRIVLDERDRIMVSYATPESTLLPF